MDIQVFDKYFLQTFQNHGKVVNQQYSKVVQNYKKYIIPFQTKRMKQNQSLSFKNTQLQRQKFKLLKTIEQLTAQQKRQQYVLKNQIQKIDVLQNFVHNLDGKNNQNLNKIQLLQVNIRQLRASVDQKINIVKQVQEDKNQVLKNCQDRNKQFQGLLKTYLRDKNAVAEKLNYMNQLEESLKDKQKVIQERQFYLKKQWEKFEQAKKELIVQKQPSSSFPQFMRKNNSKYDKDQQQPQQMNQKTKYQRVQILRYPIKKLIKYHNNQIYDLSFNYSGNLIATCGGDRAIKIYDVLNFKSGVTIQTHSVDSIYLSLGLDYSGDKLLTGSSDRSVQVFSTSTGKQLHCFVGHGYKVNSVSWSSAKEKCVSGSQDKQIKVWQIQKASNLLSIPCKSPVKFVSCNTIQPVIHSGHADGSIRLYSLTQSTSPIAHIKDIIQSPINSLVVLSNRNQVLVSTQQGSPVYLIDLKMNKLLHKYQGRQFSNGSVRAQLSPSQKYVVAGNYDGSIYYWNKDNQKFEKKITDGHQSTITALKYHFMSNVMVSCDKQGNVTIWQ